jgi:hypothetical protein
MLPHAPRIATGRMVKQIGFLEQLLINLTIRVPPQPALQSGSNNGLWMELARNLPNNGQTTLRKSER